MEQIDPVTGMIINLYDLKLYLWEVLKEFDHKNLNLDTPYFNNRIPTSENLAWTLWELLAKHPQLPALERIRLYEDDTLYAEVTRDFVQSSSSANTALIGRRYQFAAVHQLKKWSHPWASIQTVGVHQRHHSSRYWTDCQPPGIGPDRETRDSSSMGTEKYQ